MQASFRREAEPTHKVFYGDDGLSREEWWLNGKLHRLDGPAEIWYSDDGTREENWHRHGRFYRKSGPTYVATYADGGWMETYLLSYRRGTRVHRLDGPAITRVDADGRRTREWWRNRRKLTARYDRVPPPQTQ